MQKDDLKYETEVKKDTSPSFSLMDGAQKRRGKDGGGTDEEPLQARQVGDEVAREGREIK